MRCALLRCSLILPCRHAGPFTSLCAEAVKAAVAGWGQRQVDELEAEERLAFACEKAPTEDPVLLKVGAESGSVALCAGAD